MADMNKNTFEDNFENPFADPAIEQITKMAPNTRNSLEEYNPFQQEPKNPNLETNHFAPVVLPVSENTVPPVRADEPIMPSERVQITTDELKRRQEELDRKAAELDRREQQLKGNMHHFNNWPPLPDNFFLKPCFYQDFNLEIPSEFQNLIKNLYYTWMFYSLTLCCNIIGGVIILIHKGTFTNFGLSIFYAFLFTPASYVCWFRPAYKAFRSDSSFNFMVFFFVYFFQTLFSIFQAIGVPDTGYCGLIVSIIQFGSSAESIVVGLFLLCIAFCFVVTAAANVIMITKIHNVYRSTGASFAKAQAEFTTEFMRNQHVQEAARSSLNNAVNSQFNNNRF